MTLSVEYIEDTCMAYLRKARTDGLWLGPEFVRDRTYFPHLALLQIATNNRIALVDPLESQS